MPSEFNKYRRQRFLNESTYVSEIRELREMVHRFSGQSVGASNNEEHGYVIGQKVAATSLFNLLLLRYSAGEIIDPLAFELDAIVKGFEALASLERNYYGEPERPVFFFTSLDDYARLMQLIGLCYLLHRRDLLPRIANLCDEFRGQDALYEDLLAFSLNDRLDVDEWFWGNPYGHLIRSFYKDTDQERLESLDAFLKRWYKDLSGVGWHDTHKGEPPQAGYFGYWAFEAGAAVLLLDIRDDAALHKHPYYPKDLVAWARSYDSILEPDGLHRESRCEGGQLCPRTGYWFSPASLSSRRLFVMGDAMPILDAAYGATIWQWDSDQSDPSL